MQLVLPAMGPNLPTSEFVVAVQYVIARLTTDIAVRTLKAEDFQQDLMPRYASALAWQIREFLEFMSKFSSPHTEKAQFSAASPIGS
ncbi:hypothetical protein [Streptomyces rubellomurinus]|uniref:hypothetical protein n=1 Tax=Streptomyces rubellomurinus (strain ATCC 31215) TaxID=359131 RepID=UPI0012FF2272|nr:hypothetical protein [Streptomyces rubellomurinus]